MGTSHVGQTDKVVRPKVVPPEDKGRAGFFSQEYLDSLTTTVNDKKIALFANKHFFAVLKEHFIKSCQQEPTNFLDDIFKVNQRDLTPADLLREVNRIFHKYFSDPKADNFLNIGADMKNACLEAIKNGKMLTSFAPVVNEVATQLINYNICRPITVQGQRDAIPKEVVTAQLLEAYEKDKDEQASFVIFLPSRTVISSALDGIQTVLQHSEAKPQPLPDSEKDFTGRADRLMENVNDQINKMRLELQQVFRKTMEKNASPVTIQEEISKILAEFSTILQEANTGLIKKFGEKNTRSQQIETLLVPLTAAKTLHDNLTSSPKTKRQGTVKEFSAAICHTDSNLRRITDYMDRLKDVPITKPLPRHTSTLTEVLADMAKPRRKMS
ncbi:MAG TPA: hypothetical protein VLJ15_09230 [Gammaproteobacteria bacterium]|nr:hypothetical protein [Gammaproteobacteria bacterium]